MFPGLQSEYKIHDRKITIFFISHGKNVKYTIFRWGSEIIFSIVIVGGRAYSFSETYFRYFFVI